MKIKILALLLVLVLALGIFASCATPEPTPCNHRDANDDYTCDRCGDPYNDGPEKTDDKDEDEKEPKVYPLDWETTTIKLKATENSNNKELPSACARYLAGTLTEEEKTNDYSAVDIMVGKRNTNAYNTTNVNVDYSYFKEGDTYAWSLCIDAINLVVLGGSSKSADMYCNFVYDMVGASLKGSFANLLSEARGTNYFEFYMDKEFEDTGVGYMYEYMRSLTLSKFKMYCLSSDYFTDMVRAFFIVPVNVSLLQSIQVDPECNNPDYDPDAATKYNSDRTGDGEFDIDDFYNLVWDGQWNYSILADYSRAIYEPSGQSTSVNNANGNLTDTIGFALSSTSGLSASGMLYTTSVTIIHRDWDVSKQDYTYAYPTTNTDLYDFCDAITSLFSNNRGVIAVSNSAEECMNYGPDALQAIRNQFASGKVLFGGVICLGSLEYDEYKTMNQGDGNTGYGIVPVPLYRAINPETGEPDRYLTQIHNIGRVGAISAATEKFSQCTAFLDYQSLNSTDILDEYYNYKLSYDVAGGDSKNTEMLQYIRYNVRSSFDKAYEDSIGEYYASIDPNAKGDRWHEMISTAKYVFDRTAMSAKYAELAGTKQTRLLELYEQYGYLLD